MKKKLEYKIIFWLLSSIALSLLFAWIIGRGWFLSWHLKSSNFLYYNSQNQALEDIVIVAIDNKSFKLRNASELGTLQFKKADYAQVIENLEQAGAKVIGVDIIFSEISAEKDRQILTDTLTKYNNVILAAEPKTSFTEGLKPRQEFIEPQPKNIGAILFQPDRDNIVRKQRILFEDKEAKTAFGVQIVKKYLNLFPEDSELTEDGYQLMPFKVRVGNKSFPPIVIPTHDENLKIRFFGRPNSFQSISFADVYENKFTERQSGKELDLKDKIILIGEMGTGLHDEQYVPISFGQAMPGVEIHANIIQTILTQRFLVDQSKISILLIVIGIIFFGLAIFLIVNIATSVLILFFGVISYMITTWILFEYGSILNTVYPHMALVSAFIIAYVYRYFTEAKFAQKTEKAFSHYVSDTVVKKILEDPNQLKLGGIKKELTVFFSDIANFTKISEKTKAEKLVLQLNGYLDAMGEIILKRDGTLDKFIGDAIVAFWGAPIPQKDHAISACLAALEYQKKLKTLRSAWGKKGLLPFHARIGINTGEMIVGNMGSNKRFDYTVIGDSVNLGARLEGANKFYGTEILISESTYHAAKSKIEVREIDLIKVKGKTKAVRIYELLAKKGQLDKGQKQLIKQFEEGLQAYRKQDWGKALSQFKLNPNDSPSKVFIERIKELKSKKLPKDWDGVFELTAK